MPPDCLGMLGEYSFGLFLSKLVLRPGQPWGCFFEKCFVIFAPLAAVWAVSKAFYSSYTVDYDSVEIAAGTSSDRRSIILFIHIDLLFQACPPILEPSIFPSSSN
jgi:hypothetical protein